MAKLRHWQLVRTKGNNNTKGERKTEGTKWRRGELESRPRRTAGVLCIDAFRKGMTPTGTIIDVIAPGS
jgi:hypothetical protein